MCAVDVQSLMATFGKTKLPKWLALEPIFEFRPLCFFFRRYSTRVNCLQDLKETSATLRLDDKPGRIESHVLYLLQTFSHFSQAPGDYQQDYDRVNRSIPFPSYLTTLTVLICRCLPSICLSQWDWALF